MLLGLLLGAAGTCAEPLPRDRDGRGEFLLMVGSRLLDLVDRERPLPVRGELLQRRLEVAVAFAPDVGLHPRSEQPALPNPEQPVGTDGGLSAVAEAWTRPCRGMSERREGAEDAVPGERAERNDRCEPVERGNLTLELAGRRLRSRPP